MLKSNEVRIGNDVLYMDTDTPEFVRIKIDKSDIMLLCEGIQGYNYKGVPLTPEILVQCGFSIRDNGTNKDYHIGINNVTRDWLFCLVWIDGFQYPFYANGRHEITSLHQLQNLYYSLTGSELEVAW